MISRPDSVYLSDDWSPVAHEQPASNTRRNRLKIPEESDYQITAESPVDRFGPRLRRWPTASTARRTSASQLEWGGSTQCYSPIDGEQPNFTNVYSDLQVYDGTTEDIPQLQVEGEPYIAEERMSLEQQQQQQQRIKPASQLNTSQALPAKPSHCYHDSMSSEESFEMATAYSKTPVLPAIDIKTEERLTYEHPSTWKVNLIVVALAATTFCTGWVVTHLPIYF